MSRIRSILPLAATIVVLALAVLSGRRITIDNDVARLLPDSDARLVQTTKALRTLLERTVVDVGSPALQTDADGSHPFELLCEVADRLVAELLASGTVLRARARLSMEDALELANLVRAHAPLLFSESAWGEIEARLAPEAVLGAVETLERRIQEPDGAYLAQLAPTDPLGLANLALAPLASFAAGPEAAKQGAKLVEGRLLSADGKHLLVLVEPGFPSSDFARTTGFLEAVARSEAGIAAEPRYRGIELRAVGAHRSARDNEQQIRRDVKVTSLASGVLIALLSYLCLGRFRVVLLSVAPAAVGGVVALGVFALFRTSIAAPILGFGTVLIGLTIDYAVHVLTSLTSTRGPAPLPTRPLLMGALTTILAFTCLRGSALPGIRDMGTFGTIGIVAAVVFSLWVLPSLAPLLGRPRPPLIDLERVMDWMPRRSTWIALGATPLVAWGALRLEFDGDVENLSSLSPAAAADEEVVRSVWGSSQISSLLIEAPSLQAALEANDELARWLDRAVADGLVLGHASLAGLLPSPRTQAERAQRWRSFWSPERKEELRANLRAATERTHFRADAFAPFLSSLEDAPAWLEHASLQQGASAPLVADRLVRDGATWRVLTPVSTSGSEQLARLEERLRREQPLVVLANRAAMMRRIAGLVSEEMIVLGGLALLGVAAIVALWLADPLLTGVVLLPLVLGLAWTLGCLGWLGQKLNLVNAVFVVFQFGVAIDYAIFVSSSHLERRRTGLDRTAEARGSVLLCALTTCLGFGAMTLAGHPVLFTIGVTASVGIACAGTAVLLFVPPLCQSILARAGQGAPGASGPSWQRWLAGLYRYHGAFLKHYAASKAKRDPLVAALPELCPGAGTILVVGCGHGIMTARLAGAYPEREIVALDPDTRKLDSARSALGGRFPVRFLAQDIRAFSSAEASQAFEWVLLVDVLHYWDEENQREILARLLPLMNADSRLLFRDGCAGAGTKNWIVHAAEALARHTGFTRMPGRMHFHTEEAWRRVLGEGGFRVDSSFPALGLLSNLVLVCSRTEQP